MKKGKIHIGTSGWQYKHWTGTFYPAGIKAGGQFAYYLQHFETVEINSSFYHLPTITTFTGWKKHTSADFIFSVKASRFLTHMKKLNADKESIQLFLSRAEKLGDKLGPILFQLPPNWKLNVPRLASFLANLPKHNLYTFEFRNHEWYVREVYDLLKQYKCAFCIYELERHLSPMEVTADFIYVRLHGPGNKYQGNYDKTALKKWSRQCIKWQKLGKDVYIYFDNDEQGYAAFNAGMLSELIHQNSIG